jgi:hypothetical protein
MYDRHADAEQYVDEVEQVANPAHGQVFGQFVVQGPLA